MKKIHKSLDRATKLFSIYTLQQAEDVLFETFERAHQHSDGDTDSTREDRAVVHAELRQMLRQLHRIHQHNLKKKRWKTIPQNNITETR